MSVSNWFRASFSLRKKEVISALWVRTFCTAESVDSSESSESGEQKRPSRNKIINHPLEKCLEYMDSEAYKYTYKDKPVWHLYIRNFKGAFPPQTRKTCIRRGVISTGSPCPICRDQYLLPHYLNIKLLKQFMSPEGGYILSTMKTGVCQKQQFRLEVAIKKAQNYGLLSFTVPHRSYDYSLYNKK